MVPRPRAPSVPLQGLLCVIGFPDGAQGTQGTNRMSAAAPRAREPTGMVRGFSAWGAQHASGVQFRCNGMARPQNQKTPVSGHFKAYLTFMAKHSTQLNLGGVWPFQAQPVMGRHPRLDGPVSPQVVAPGPGGKPAVSVRTRPHFRFLWREKSNFVERGKKNSSLDPQETLAI